MSRREGIVHGLEEASYHAGPELSVSGAKDLLKAPALFRWRREHPQTKAAFDLGSVVHTLVLGTGWPVEVVEGGRGRSEREAAARAAGRTPISPEDHDLAQAMATAVREHPLAGRIFASDGEPEVSMFWTDERSGVRCRARVDFLHRAGMVDLKTARDASPGGFTRAAANLGYGLQAAAYRAGYEAITGQQAPPFLFVAVDKEPPHLVLVAQLDDVFLDHGARRWDDALDVFAACSATGEWPGFGDEVLTLTAPRWLS